MKASLKVCQNCRDGDHLESSMGKRKKLMGHSVVALMVGTCWIVMEQSEIGSWIFLI